MDHDLLRHGEVRRHQEGRPVDGVEPRDVLADDMGIRGPEAGARRIGIGKARGGEIVGQRVHPDIHHVLRIARNRDAPVEGGAADRKIVQTALHKGNDLVLVMLRNDEIRPLLVEAQQAIRIGREPEEVAFLFHPFDRRAGLDGKAAAVALLCFVLAVVGLVAHRVPAGILRQIDVALGGHPAPDLLNGNAVPLRRRAQDVVGAGVQFVAHVLKLLRRAIGKGHGRQPFPGCRLLHLLTVLIHAGDEKNVIAIETLEPRNGIRGNPLIGVADVRRAIGIGYGRGRVELRFRHVASIVNFRRPSAPLRHASAHR